MVGAFEMPLLKESYQKMMNFEAYA